MATTAPPPSTTTTSALSPNSQASASPSLPNAVALKSVDTKPDVDKLTQANYTLWRIRIKAHLITCSLWDNAIDCPADTNLAASILIMTLSDKCLQMATATDLTAPAIWHYFKEKFVTSNLSSQSQAFLSLVNYSYDGKTILENETELLRLRSELGAAFNDQKQISLDDLLTLFALVKVPIAYQALRSTLEETTKGMLTFSALFQSLAREESSQTASSANRVTSATLSSSAPDRCQHNRPPASCWACHPHLRPTCLPCKGLGIQKYRHKTGSNYCRSQQTPKSAEVATTSAALSASSSEVRFNVDSGSTDTLVQNKDHVDIYSSLHHPIEVANGNYIYANAVGKLPGESTTLDPVLVCPQTTQNLLSVSKMEDQGYDTLFSKGKVYVGTGMMVGKVILSGQRMASSYYIDFKRGPSTAKSLSAASPAKPSSLDEWHLKFNHLNEKDLRLLVTSDAVTGLKLDPADSLNPCHGCLVGKARKGTTPKTSISQSTYPGELVHADVVGPISPVSTGGNRYFLVLVDDFSKYFVTYCLRAKSEVFSKFQEFDRQLFNRTQRHTLYLRSDNGGEFQNGVFSSYCNQHGIIQQFTVPYHSSQNGTAERSNLTILNLVRAMIHTSGLSKDYWDEAVYSATYSRNRSLSTADPTKTPYEQWYGSVPDVSHLQSFGRLCYVTTSLASRSSTGSSKLAPRGEQCLFLGYSRDSKGYRLLVSATTKIIVATYEDVVFPRQLPAHCTTGPVSSQPTGNTLQSTDGYFCPVPPSAPLDDDTFSEASFHSVNSVPVPLEDLPLDDPPPPVTLADALTLDPKLVPIPDRPGYYRDPSKGTVEIQPVDLPPIKDITGPPLHPKRAHPAVDYSSAFSASALSTESYILPAEDVVNLLDFHWYTLPPSSCLSTESVPVRYEDIEALANRDDWYRASDQEIASLIEHGTWELVPLPKDRRAINCKWVFRIKRDADGTIIKYKARLCACGYSQIPGLDYKDIYSPVVRAESLRLMLSIVAARDMELHQMDVVTAFLNGDLTETIFMKQPPGYRDPVKPDHVCQLHKNLYGLKQAPRVWHKTIDPFLRTLGFEPLVADPCLYVKWNHAALSMIALYVDDLAIAADHNADLHATKSALKTRFKMTDEGSLEFILGIKVRRNRPQRAIYLSNDHYTTALLNDFNMLTCNAVSTPMDCLTVSSADCPTPQSPEWLRMQTVPYRQCVGRLTYLSRTSRPDLAYSVSVVNRFLHNPGEKHWNAVKRIMKYLKGTAATELCLQPLNFTSHITTCDRTSPVNGPLRLSGNTDADWGGHTDTSRSTSGYGFFLGNSLISWAAKAQTTTATSSTYAEYIAAYHAATECIWLRSFLSALKMLPPQATTVYCDNMPTIEIARFHMITPRTKHFDTKYHYLREQIECGAISLEHCPGKDNVADLFTKPLAKNKFRNFAKELGLVFGTAD